MALIADVLTASRVVLAVFVGAALARLDYPTAVILLVVAWLTDFFDGILARAARGKTRLGDWDFRVDVTLGVAILVGLVISDVLRLPLVAVAVVLGAGWTQYTGNPAPAMLLLALAYGVLLAVLIHDVPRLWWLPFVAVALLLTLQWRRFVRVILPAFFQGLGTIVGGKRVEAPPVLDRWS